MRTKSWSENLKERNHSEDLDLDLDGRTILEWILRKCGGKVLSEFVWYKTGISCGP